MMQRGTFRLLFSSVLIALLSACVTTTNEPFKNTASEEDELAAKLQLAKSYIRNGNNERARFHLKHALEMAPRSADVNDALGLLFKNTGEDVLANKHFKLAIEYGNGASRFRNNYAVFLYQQKKYSQARDEFQIVVNDALYENRTTAMLSLAYCERQLGNENAAVVLFNRVLKVNRLHPVALFEISSIYYREGSYERAKAMHDRLSQISRPTAPVLFLGWQIAEKLGDGDTAASYALKLQSFFPKSKEYSLYRQAIE